eukprot:6576381-Pyramimonas_sp.AAC.1
MGQRNAVLGGRGACGRFYRGLLWSSLWATKRCFEWGKRLWTLPLGPSVEVPMGPRGDACGLIH